MRAYLRQPFNRLPYSLLDDFLSEKVQEHGIARFGKKERACNRLDYRLLLADRVGFEPTSRLRDYLISSFMG